MYLSLYRKYRPKTFEEMYGEKYIIKAIKNSLRNNRVAHAYLFSGPRGVGKTTTARIISKGVNCLENGVTDTPCNQCENCKAIDKGNFFDMIEIDAASNRGIDEIRNLKDKIHYKPVSGRRKVYIIDEVHMLTKEAFNALLKTLEEPPEHIIFILATTEPDKVLDTIISRCQRFDFTPVAYDEILNCLQDIAEKENINIDEKSLKLIYEKSGGSVRDSISIFEKISSAYFGEDIDSEKTREILGIIKEEKIEIFLKQINENAYDEAMNFFDELLKEGINIEDFLKEFANHIKNLVLDGKKDLSPNYIVDIIDTIYDIIFKFRFEEDKRLLAYVLISRLMTAKQSEPTKVISNSKETKNVEQYLKSDEIENTQSEKARIKRTGNIDTATLKRDWSTILEKAKEVKISLVAFLSMAFPIKAEEGIIHIGFPAENKYHKISMEKKENRKIFVNILREMYGDVDLEFEVVGRVQNENSKDEIVQKIVDFFDGEIIDTK